MIRQSIAAMLMCVLAGGPHAAAVDLSGAGAPSHAGDPARVGASYATLPLVFERTEAADDRGGAFIARGAEYAVAISLQGAQVRLRRASPGAPAHEADFALRFVDAADPGAAIEGVERSPTLIHHIGGSAEAFDVPAWRRVAISALYPGIDVVFHGNGRRLEYDVVVAPGGDPARFALRAGEGVSLSLTDAGGVSLAAPGTTLTLERPLAYQDIDGVRQEVASAFAISGERDLRIEVGAYDRTRPLVIDPVISYAALVGGNDYEQGSAIAVDAAGNAYVAGYTRSTDFPTTLGAFDRAFGKRGDTDVFVSKLNAAGTALVWSTYIGGSSGTDRAIGIAIDAAGSAYVTGSTSGTDFPTTAGAWQKAVTGGGGFVAKLVPAGNALVYSTYVANATPSAIAIDAAGNAYVSGSAKPGFATTAGALQPVARNSLGTGFVLALGPTGTAPVFSTFLGGAVGDYANSIAVDAGGNVYVGGWTTSNDFPVVNAFQSAPSGRQDGFVAKLAPGGSKLVYSTRLGGALDDAVNALAIDASGNVYVAGETYSWDFPTKNAFQPQKAGQLMVNASVGSAFVTKLGPTGSTLVYSSFLGGEVCQRLCQTIGSDQYFADVAYGIAVDGSGHAYVTGTAVSYTFPLVDSAAARKQQDNQQSEFVTKIGISGATLLWSTFTRTGFGDPSYGLSRFPPSTATAVAIDPAGAAYVTGDSDIYSYYEVTPGAFRTVTGNQGAMLVKFAPAPAMSIATSNPAADSRTPIVLTATVAGSAPSGSVTFLDGPAAIGSAAIVGNQANLSLTLPAGIHALSAVLRQPGMASDTPILYQVVDAPLRCD